MFQLLEYTHQKMSTAKLTRKVFLMGEINTEWAQRERMIELLEGIKDEISNLQELRSKDPRYAY